MKKTILILLALAALLAGITSYGKESSPPVRRVGMVIGIKPDQIGAYKALHAASNPGVRDLLAKYHMHNFSIYVHKLDEGKYYLFGYYEYTGKDYEGDMKMLAAEPRNQQWLSVTGPMQIPLAGESSWTMMDEAYHNR
jgi:L-rhamnose mutarotase